MDSILLGGARTTPRTVHRVLEISPSVRDTPFSLHLHFLVREEAAEMVQTRARGSGSRKQHRTTQFSDDNGGKMQVREQAQLREDGTTLH